MINVVSVWIFSCGSPGRTLRANIHTFALYLRLDSGPVRFFRSCGRTKPFERQITTMSDVVAPDLTEFVEPALFPHGAREMSLAVPSSG